MNRTQIIILLIALAIAGAVAFLFMSGPSDPRAFLVQTRQIGQELIATTNSQRLMVIGSGLHERLAQLLASPTLVEEVLPGDEPEPLGNGKATTRLILKNQKGERLGIRLQKREDGDKIDVLGYWTPGSFMEFNSRPMQRVPLH
ncbi:MAG TPA: hypothetical protein VNT99_07630 [Methylomirabilota bacterium]|nr:hypothetical protein [Methylomirabilota bacterium]